MTERLPASPPPPPLPRPASTLGRWVAGWCAAQQLVEPDNALHPDRLVSTTLRQIVRVRLAGACWRLRISNEFGDSPLQLAAAGIARALAPGGTEVDPSAQQRLSFAGHAGVSVPPGATQYSDAVDLALGHGQDVAVSLALAQAPSAQTGHPGSRANSFTAPGQQVDASLWRAAEAVEHWYWLSDLEAWSPPSARALVAIGDSITDGRGSTTDGNDRWTDLLAQRLAAAGGEAPAVLNAALGGNRLLHDGIGPSLRSRFERDVLARAGVSHALLQIGINDLGTRREPGSPDAARPRLDAATRRRFHEEMVAAFSDLAASARARGIVLIGSTLTPWAGHAGYLPDADDEADRQALNRWIRESGNFDAVADFDAALRDHADPARMRDGLHCGDWLHPSPAGLVALAEAVPLAALRPR